MNKAKTRLTLENNIEGFLNATLDIEFSNGESIRLNFQLPRRTPSQPIHEIETAMLQRVQDLAKYMLQN